MMNAKMKTLDHIIDMMDEHMLGRAKKPQAGAPAAKTAEPQADMASVTQTKVEAPADDMDPEMAKQLMQMYEQGDEPVDVNAGY